MVLKNKVFALYFYKCDFTLQKNLSELLQEKETFEIISFLS